MAIARHGLTPWSYSLRVTAQILWAVPSDAIAAYSTTDGQLLMRSNLLWLPGEVIVFGSIAARSR